jgi:predicted DNA-binding transcriptional regulator YafY
MARGDQLSRQWKLIQTLMAAHRGMTASQLAAQLECHPRTAYRDLEALEAAGFPLYTEQQSGKTFWSMLDGHRQQMPLPLSLTELMALYFSRNMLKILKGTAIFDSLTQLFDKVKATLPPPYLAYLKKMENSLAVGVKAHNRYERLKEILSTVTEATQSQRLVEMNYFTMSRQTPTKRRVAPYTLWFYNETFYLIGYCHLRGEVRIFAVDRIRDIHLCEEGFDLPSDFDAEAFMQQSFGIFQGKPMPVDIRFGPEAAGYIREKIWHPSQELNPQPDGSLIFHARVAGLEEIKYWVLRWGAQATVIAPAELRREVSAEAEKMLANYKAPTIPPNSKELI